MPFGDGYYRIIAWDRHNQQPDEAEVSLSEVRSITRAAMGTDFGMHDARWLSRFHSDERQVPRYRVGRVFLAGDAAHVHSPALGLGMNTGLQDAANLGWKLAAAVQGWGPADVLDTYHAERHPVGRFVLRAQRNGAAAGIAAAVPASGGTQSRRRGGVADRAGGATSRGAGVRDRHRLPGATGSAPARGFPGAGPTAGRTGPLVRVLAAQPVRARHRGGYAVPVRCG